MRLTRRFIRPSVHNAWIRTYVNRMTNLTSGQKGVGYTAEAATSVEKSERVAERRDGGREGGGKRRRRRRGGDGYTELPNEATAVDFVQPLCRMRQWSCNRLPINNALVSGARARGGRRRRKKKGESKREVEERKRERERERGEGREREDGGRRRGGETSATSRERRRSGASRPPHRARFPNAFVLVDDVAGLVHYPCVILIVFTLRLIDVR